VATDVTVADAKVFVIHENEEWLPPLRAAFSDIGVPYETWHLNRHCLKLSAVAPQGVFFSRMSASSHTRGHRHAHQSADLVLRWLESQGRRVINGSAVLALEMSKAAQQLALSAAGFDTPKTLAAVGADQIPGAARQLARNPFILKPNRGGKGLGVTLYEDLAGLERSLADGGPPESVDEIWLLQEKIESDQDFITRMEFIGGAFHYAVRVYTQGSFLLCPADHCTLDLGAFCPTGPDRIAGQRGQAPAAGPRFEIVPDFDDPLVPRLERFLAAQGIEVGGVEFIRRPDGTPVIYDINANTNYNSAAEAAAALSQGGMQRLASFLAQELEKLKESAGRRAVS
jgi:hypothetical protein